ncbi:MULTISPECIES: hypothetical protein [Rhizobium]|uniref:Uncharacterized protein n=1 Tax=Rhizobium esperanzae TaxID=1967781 RepID=A0A7W6UH98_9HYPH|nr:MULTISPECIES: hypothetical protein [Rhizobium]MBB4438147.1 hypothetical protein [Rhizobium esperanzae]MDH6200968.1 hypothetical protein [Rhizobium leguminosarum]
MAAAYTSLPEKAINELLQKLAREIEQIVVDAGEKFIDDTNSDLAAAKKGDTILGLLVTDHVNSRIELQYRDFLKFGFAKVRFAIDDQLNHGPEYFLNVEIKALLGDIRISKDGSYEVILGYGFDAGPPPYQAARGKIALKNPSLSIDAFLAGSPDDGFVIDFGLGTGSSGSSGFPLVIPLGPSGFGLQGIGGTFADNFRPNLAPTSPNGVEPERPAAFDYVKWAQEQARKPLDGWRPLRPEEGHVGGVGLRTDIIDLCTSGGLVRVRDAGFLALSDGPLVVQGGRGQLLSLPPDSFRLDTISALDFRTLTYAMAGAAAFRLPGDPDDWELVAASGSITAQISLLNSRDWFFNVGTEGAPISGSFLKDWFKAEVFCMTNFDRIYVGAKLTFGGRDINLLGLKLDAYFGMQTRAKLGFQPLHFEGSLILFGGVGLRIWKFKIGIELSGIVSIAVLKPFHLRIQAGWKISLPWPLSDMSGTITLLEHDKIEVAAIAMPILLQAAIATSGDFGGTSVEPSQKLGAVHPLSGLQFDILDETAKIWPDCELALPFYRKLTDLTGRMLSPPIGSSREGSVQVTHSLTELDLFSIRDDGSEVKEEGVQGVWTVGPANQQGDFNSPTARLHFPANDPFRWLDQYQVRSEETEVLPPIGEVFDFGIGPAEFDLPEILLPTVKIRRAEEVTGIDLLADPVFQLPTRVARLSRASFEIRDETPSAAFSRVIITFVANDENSFGKLQSDRYLQILSVTDQTLPSGRTFYFGRIEITDSSGQDFREFTIGFQGDSGCAIGITGLREHCFPMIAVFKITLFGGTRTATTVKDRTIFKPGVYRVAASGKSEWAASGEKKAGSWKFSQKFNVIYPPTITPYIAYVTAGDERPYREKGLNVWNPTPYGLGFPIYTAQKASIVFRPDYFNTIFPKLRVGYDQNEQEVDVNESGLDERFESASSAKWFKDSGGPYDVCREVLFDPPTTPGVRDLSVGFFNPLTNKTVALDGWSFETSRYGGIHDHLALDQPIILTARSAVSEISSSDKDVAIAALDTKLVTKQPKAGDAIPAAWRLPPSFEPEHKDFEKQSSLSFLRFFERAAIAVSRVNADPMEGLLERPGSALVDAFTDRDGKAFCFWVRTPEPLDWRRLSASILVYAIDRDNGGAPYLPDVAPVPLEALFTPSPDGASALMFVRMGETYVRLPAGLYVAKFSFALEAPKLTHLRSQTNQKTDSFELRFANTFGRPFAGALN